MFFNATTVSLQGEGPEGSAEHGYLRDRRPDLRQIVVAVAMTKGGVPIAHEVFPGSTSDVKSFAQVISSLVARFPIGRVIVVSDRGTMSEENLALFSELGLSYIVGVRAFSWRGGPGVQGSLAGEGGAAAGGGPVVDTSPW